MVGSSVYQDFYRISAFALQRMALHINATKNLKQIEAALKTKKVKSRPMTKFVFNLAHRTAMAANALGKGVFKEPPTPLNKFKQAVQRIGFRMGITKLPLENIEFEINRALYLEKIEKDYPQAQKIYRHYVKQYLTLYRQDPVATEATFHSLHNLKKTHKFWVSAGSPQGNAIADAMAMLTTFHVQNDSYILLQQLATLGHGIAILKLNTRKDKDAVPIIKAFLHHNEYAKSKAHHEFLQQEAWALELFCWNKAADGQVEIIEKQHAYHPISFMEAVEAYHPLAFEQFYSQQTCPNAIERLDIIKRIMALEVDIDAIEDDENTEDSMAYSDALIEIAPHRSHPDLTPLLPSLEKHAYDKLTAVIAKYPNYTKARELLAECYELAIGTEQSLIK